MAEQAKGFGSLTCLKCGQEAVIRIDLDDLSTFTCCECDEEFTRANVERVLGQWAQVLTWIDTAPSATP